MAPRKEIAPAQWAEARRLFENTLVPVKEIAAMVGLARTTLRRRAKAEGWTMRRAPMAPLPSSLPDRAVLAARIRDLVDRELCAVERVLEVIQPADAAEADRSARTLANIARATREIVALNQPPEATPPDEADDDPLPRDLDDFRHELARRIRGFIEARRSGAD